MMKHVVKYRVVELAKTLEEYNSLTKQQHLSSVDAVDEILKGGLLIDKEWRPYINAAVDENAITGLVQGDLFIAAHMIQKICKEKGFGFLAEMPTREVRRSLVYALRRHKSDPLSRRIPIEDGTTAAE